MAAGICWNKMLSLRDKWDTSDKWGAKNVGTEWGSQEETERHSETSEFMVESVSEETREEETKGHEGWHMDKIIMELDPFLCKN